MHRTTDSVFNIAFMSQVPPGTSKPLLKDLWHFPKDSFAKFWDMGWSSRVWTLRRGEYPPLPQISRNAYEGGPRQAFSLRD